MKRKIRTIALLTTLVLAGTAVLSWPSLLKYMVQSTLTELRSKGVSISWSGVSTSMAAINLESATGWVSVPAAQRNGRTLKIPVTLDVQRLSVKLRGTSLLSLAPSFPFAAELYGGTLKGETQPLGKNSLLDITIDNVELGKHPQIAALGIQGGVITASGRGLRINPQQLPEGSFTLSLANLTPPSNLSLSESSPPVGPMNVTTSGSIEGGTLTLKSFEISSPLGLVESTGTFSGLASSSSKFSATTRISLADATMPSLVPQIKYLLGDERFPDVDLSWKGAIEGENLSFDSVKVTSSLVSADGKAKVTGVRTPRPSIEGNVRVTLSERGGTLLGKWLPLLTGGGVESSAKTFRINFNDADCQEPGAGLLYGQVCLKATFME